MNEEELEELIEYKKKMKEAVKHFKRFQEIAYLNELWERSK